MQAGNYGNSSSSTLTMVNTGISRTLIYIIVGAAGGIILIGAIAIWLICKYCCRSTTQLQYMRSQQSTMFSGPSTLMPSGSPSYVSQPMMGSQPSFYNSSQPATPGSPGYSPQYANAPPGGKKGPMSRYGLEAQNSSPSSTSPMLQMSHFR